MNAMRMNPERSQSLYLWEKASPARPSFPRKRESRGAADNARVQIQRCPSSKGKVSQRGFTLVEMLVVLAIISLMLAVAAPSFKNFSDKQKLQTAGDGIRSLAHYARDTAMADGEPYMIVFDFVQQTFWLSKASALEYGDLSMSAYLGSYGPEAESMSPEEMIAERAHGILGDMREIDAVVSIDRVDVEREGAIASGAPDYEYVQFNADGTAEPASVYLLNNQNQAAVVDVWLRASRIDVRMLNESEASALAER